MSTAKHINIICIAVIILTLVITVAFMFGEKLGITVIHKEEDEETNSIFTENDLDDDWDTSGATVITLKGDSATVSGNGAYFSDDTVYIAYAGKYLLSGTLDGSINIDADGDDKIWLLFDNVEINSNTDSPIYIKQADKVFITLKENSENTLNLGNSDEETEIDGAVFSRDDLTINGSGKLTVTSSTLHGIVCNDSLVFAGGDINLTAGKDAVHAHDAIKICNTNITVSAGDDGLHAGNDDETSVFYLESGNINITDCYEGIEANDITIAGGTVNITPSDDGLNACGNGANSLITISGGSLTVINENGRDADGLDSNGSINITGGNVFVSVVGSGTNNALDYGSENNGKCTISGGTVIACGSSQMAEGPEQDSKQGFIMQTVSGSADSTLSLLDKDGNEILSKEIPCSFTSLIVSTPEISVGDTVTLKIGDSETEITIDNSSSSSSMGGMMGGGFGNNQGNKNSDNGSSFDFPNNNNFTKPNGFGNDNQSAQNQFQSENQTESDNQTETGTTNTDFDFSTLILIGVSIIILGIGLAIAIKKKY